MNYSGAIFVSLQHRWLNKICVGYTFICVLRLQEWQLPEWELVLIEGSHHTPDCGGREEAH
jgi:hypothetical protein